MSVSASIIITGTANIVMLSMFTPPRKPAMGSAIIATCPRLENGDCMKRITAITAVVVGLALAACGSSDPPTAKTTPTTPPATNAAAKTEPKHDTPDTHGMPGMSELFKGDDKKADKADDKK